MPDGGIRCHEKTSATTSDTLNWGVLGAQSGQAQMLLAAEELITSCRTGGLAPFIAQRNASCSGVAVQGASL